jgi:hypothetical protein
MAGCSTELIAASEDDFWSRIHEDKAAWQLRVLADECRRMGMLLCCLQMANVTRSRRRPCWGEKNMLSITYRLHRGRSGSPLLPTCSNSLKTCRM